MAINWEDPTVNAKLISVILDHFNIPVSSAAQAALPHMGPGFTVHAINHRLRKLKKDAEQFNTPSAGTSSSCSAPVAIAKGKQKAPPKIECKGKTVGKPPIQTLKSGQKRAADFPDGEHTYGSTRKTNVKVKVEEDDSLALPTISNPFANDAIENDACVNFGSTGFQLISTAPSHASVKTPGLEAVHHASEVTISTVAMQDG